MKTIQKYLLCFIFAIILSVLLLINNAKKSLPMDQHFVKCGRFPKQTDIEFDNEMWQVHVNSDGLLFLWNAYLDLRWNKSVVINAIGAGINLGPENFFCQYWFKNRDEPIVVQAYKFQNTWRTRRFGRTNLSKAPYLIFCPLATDGEAIPKSVSVTGNRCDKARNNLIIIDNQPKNGVKKKFGICTKQFTFKKREDTIKFVEWAEMMRILGADKIHTFNRFFHPDLYKISKYYEDQDFLEALPFKEPSSISNARFHVHSSLFLELSVVNDCFYRVRNLYDYIAILDPDELFLPVQKNDENWHDLLKNFEDVPKTDGFAIRSVAYPPGDGKTLDSVAKYHYMLQHTQRAIAYKSIPGPVFNCKSIIIPDEVTVAYTHGAEYCNDRECTSIFVSTNVSQVSHYRDKLKQKSDANTFEDKILWKFKDKLVKAVAKTIKDNKFKP